MFIIYERTLLSTDFVARKCARICNCQPCSAKVLALQWFRDEANLAYWRANSSGRGLGAKQRWTPSKSPSLAKAIGLSCELCPSGSLILINVGVINVGVASRATGRESEPTKHLRRQPLPKRVFPLAGLQRVHALPRPQPRRCFQVRQPCW